MTAVITATAMTMATAMTTPTAMTTVTAPTADEPARTWRETGGGRSARDRT